MRQRIYVTQHNIDNAERGDPWACMVASACHDAGFPIVSIGDTLYIPDSCDVEISQSIRQRIRDWEFFRPVSPFFFDVWLLDGDIVQIGDAFDMDTHTADCDGLVGEIETFLMDIYEVTA